MVRDGTYTQCTVARAGCVHIQGSYLHLHSEHSHVDPLVGMGILTIEHIRRQHITNLVLISELLARLHRLTYQAEVAYGSECARHLITCCIVAVGAGTHSYCQVADMQVVVDRTSRSHTDDCLHAIEVIELIGVDADRGHTHAVSHHTYSLSLIGTCKAQHATHLVETYCIVEEFLGHQLHSQRVTRHNHRLGDFAVLCPDMGSWSLVHNL